MMPAQSRESLVGPTRRDHRSRRVRDHLPHRSAGRRRHHRAPALHRHRRRHYPAPGRGTLRAAGAHSELLAHDALYRELVTPLKIAAPAEASGTHLPELSVPARTPELRVGAFGPLPRFRWQGSISDRPAWVPLVRFEQHPHEATPVVSWWFPPRSRSHVGGVV